MSSIPTTEDHKRHVVAFESPELYEECHSKGLKRHYRQRGGITTSKSSSSKTKERTPVVENRLPVAPPDECSARLMKTLEWVDTQDEQEYFKLVHSMVTLLRVSYKLYGEECMFALDHCLGKRRITCSLTYII